MYTQTLLFALVAAPLVAAHGKIAVVTGDQGGNGTALGIRGAIIAGAGDNDDTELDTTVYKHNDIAHDYDFGGTELSGDNEIIDVAQSMALSGSTLPQVSAGGSVNGTFHIVTTDGAGPLEAIVDESATGKWSEAKSATVSTQVPGDNGEINSDGTVDKRRSLHKTVRRWLARRGVLSKRADNVNKDYDFGIDMPSDAACTGMINGQTNVCLVKVSNNNDAGPFGGIFAVQMPNGTAAAKTRRVRAVPLGQIKSN